MLKTRSSAVLSLALVFVSGVLVGVLAHRAYTVRAASVSPQAGRKPSRADFRKFMLSQMQAKLKLDGGQTQQLNAIFDQMDAEVGDLNAKRDSQIKTLQTAMQEKIKGILRPDQLDLYAQYRAEREKDRERRKMQGPPGGPGGPPGGPDGPPPPGPPPDSK